MNASYTDPDLPSPVGTDFDHDASMDSDLDSEMDGENAGAEQRVSGIVKSEIEDMVLSFLRQLAHRNSNAASEKNSKPKVVLQLANRTSQTEGPQQRQLVYPRKCNSGSARPFAQLFRVMDIAHEAVIDDISSTKRDMYYKDVPLFGTQRVVDNLVDDLAATFEVERSDLNVRATSKGLVCGSSLSIHLRSGEVLQPNDSDGTLIPVGEDIQSFSLVRAISWVLIVEKDAVFQTLYLRSPRSSSPLILSQGKGYPDLATRHLVKTLSDCLQDVPILALVDADAYGLDILSVYKYGSRSLRHEVGKLAAARMEWMGVKGSELNELGVHADHLLPFTKQDEKMALTMLRRPDLPQEWRKELSRMLFTRRKAEIEVLSNIKVPLARDTSASDTDNSSFSQNCSLYDFDGNLIPSPEISVDASLFPQVAQCSASATRSSAPLNHPLVHYVVLKIQAALAG
ncbi:DNA topoisomerase IV, alpha subunit [Schizophyllum commune H4-8]|nr:DNA topoisomerase IV, alpha subunit [Schizophyllum commune H4-8]KAI5890426.1 DNA topoisomerase IV, alpha subunit [Schizophyllum commune H4-8]